MYMYRSIKFNVLFFRKNFGLVPMQEVAVAIAAKDTFSTAANSTTTIINTDTSTCTGLGIGIRTGSGT